MEKKRQKRKEKQKKTEEERKIFFLTALILVVISMKLLSFGDDPLQGSDLKVSPPRGLPKITPVV